MHIKLSKLVLWLLMSLLLAFPPNANAHWQKAYTEATETSLPVYQWQSATDKPKGVVLLLHGMTERTDSLRCIAQLLALNGFAVYGLDERGHGWWHFHQPKGAPGYSCDFSGTVTDVEMVLNVLKKRNPQLPILIMGESVGAAVAWRATAQSPKVVDAAVLTGTGYKCAHVKISWIVGDIFRNWFRWNHQINIVRYQLKYGTDDLPAFQEMLKDPEQRKTMSLIEMLRMRMFIRKNCKFAARLDPHTSILVVQGECDRVLRPKSAKRVFDSANSLDKHFVVIPKCGHIIIGNSRLKPLVQESIITFVNEIARKYKSKEAVETVFHNARASNNYQSEDLENPAETASR